VEADSLLVPLSWPGTTVEDRHHDMMLKVREFF
jgi:hypothetical protein